MGFFSRRAGRWLALLGGVAILCGVIFARKQSLAGEDGGVTMWELCASNHGSLTDGRGAHPDWIELTNTAGEPINLRGFTVSDGRKAPSAALPDYMLMPGEYFVICASGEAGWDGLYYHVPFRLSARGELVILADPRGRVLQTILLPPMGEDESYGMSSSGNMAKMAAPTPGAANGAEETGIQAAPMAWVEGRR